MHQRTELNFSTVIKKLGCVRFRLLNLLYMNDVSFQPVVTLLLTSLHPDDGWYLLRSSSKSLMHNVTIRPMCRFLNPQYLESLAVEPYADIHRKLWVW